MSLNVLRQRAELLRQLREFFYNRDFLEVETPIASREVIPEQHIAPVSIDGCNRYLQASPELHMKQLLCQKSGPIYQVTRAFRDDELGDHHRPEFTMIEWYRPGDDMRAGIDLLVEIVQTLLPISTVKQTSYRDAFQSVLGIDPHVEPIDNLKRLVSQHTNINLSDPASQSDERNEWLNVLLSHCVELTLGSSGAEVLYHYPASQSALAKIAFDEQGVPVAERFEIYVDGLELANGYHELTDADELECRLVQVNKQRQTAGMPTLPLPEALLSAMRSPGLPASAGVALGFDRLVMLATGAKTIAEVVAFPEP